MDVFPVPPRPGSDPGGRLPGPLFGGAFQAAHRAWQAAGAAGADRARFRGRGSRRPRRTIPGAPKGRERGNPPPSGGLPGSNPMDMSVSGTPKAPGDLRQMRPPISPAVDAARPARRRYCSTAATATTASLRSSLPPGPPHGRGCLLRAPGSPQRRRARARPASGLLSRSPAGSARPAPREARPAKRRRRRRPKAPARA